VPQRPKDAWRLGLVDARVGIAFDIDPEHNALKTRAPAATLSKAVYGPLWGFVEAEGLASLGRTAGYDWMHFQAARV